MSTTTVHRHRNLLHPSPEDASAPPPARKSRRRRWWIVGVSVVLLAWFLPALVAHTPIVDRVVHSVASDLNGQVSVEAVSLGWFSPVRVQGISLADKQQQQVLEVPQAESEKTLLGLLLNSSRPGTFRLVAPKLSVAFQGGSSNIEQILAAYLESDEESTSQVGFGVEVVDGSVLATDVDRGRCWSIEKLQVAVQIPGDGAPLSLTASGVLADPQQGGRFDLTLEMPLDAPPDDARLQQPLAVSEPSTEAPVADSTTTPITLQWNSETMPLALFEPLLGRYVSGTRLDGRVTAKVDLVLGSGPAAKYRATGKILARDFYFTTPALGSDQVRMANVKLECDATTQDTELIISRSSVECDLGNMAIAGKVDLAEQSLADMPGVLAAQPWQLEGVVDLAQVAAMLPDTLGLRADTQVTSGQARFSMESRRGEDGMTWQGQLASDALKAVSGGRQVSWDQPVVIHFVANETKDGPPAGELRCQSEFLKLHAAGTTSQFAADASFHLDRLMEQLEQFIDLGSLDLSGEGWSHLAWQRTPEGSFEADLELHVQGLHVALPDRPPWAEPELVVFAKSSGSTDFDRDTRVDSASIQVAAGGERLDARLLRPVLELREGGAWPIGVEMQGDLANWPPRMAMAWDLGDYAMAGRYELKGEATVSPKTLHLAGMTLHVDALEMTLPGMQIAEPQAEVQLTGVWNSETARLSFEQTTLRTTSFAAVTQDLAITLAGGQFALTGTVAYQGQLRGLQQWIRDSASASWQLDGRLVGSSRFEHVGGKTHGVIEADIENLQVTGAGGPPFQDPRVRLAGRGSYDAASHAIVLDGLKLTSQTLGMDGQGTVNMSGETAVVQFGGQMEYDMQQISALLTPYLGAGVQLVGRETRPFALNGPLDLERANANAAIGWRQGGIYGFPFGPGELNVRLDQGTLAADPLVVAVSQGQVRLAPKVHLAPGPMLLTLEPGSQASQIQITPAMCASGLQYIAPILAGVTTAQGAFSIELDRCRVPVDNPERSDVAGRFIIHSIAVGPGPLIRELAILLEREAPAQLRRESIVPFRLIDGRVYHENLELIFPDITIRTEGSVGLDRTLSIVATLPIPSKWLNNETLRSAFEGQELRIPVGGTLASPKLDRAELDTWNRRLIRNAAQNVIRDQVDRGLDRLFRPR